MRKTYFVIFCILFKYFSLSAEEQISITDESQAYRYASKLQNEALPELVVIQCEQFIRKFPLSPKLAQIHSWLADSYYSLGQYSKARETYLKILLLFPDSPYGAEAQFGIASSFQETGNDQAAIASFQQVFQSYPDSEPGKEGLYKAALLLSATEKNQEGLFVVEKLLEQSIHKYLLSKARFLKYDILCKLGRYAEAMEGYAGFIQSPMITNDFEIASLKLSEIYFDIGNFQKSEDTYLVLISRTKNDSILNTGYFLLGKQHYLLRQIESAEKNLKQVKKISKQDVIYFNAQYLLGLIAESRGAYQESVQYLQVSNRIFSIKYTLALCSAYIKNENFVEAQTSLNALFNQSDLPQEYYRTALLLNAELYGRQKQYMKQLQMYRLFIQMDLQDPLIPFIQFRRADLYINSMNQSAHGLQIIQELLESGPPRCLAPEIQYLYATAMVRMGNYQQAKSAFTEIIGLYQGTAASYRALHQLDSLEYLIPIRSSDIVQGLTHSFLSLLQDDQSQVYLRIAEDIGFRLKNYEQGLLLLKQGKRSLMSAPLQAYAPYLLGEFYYGLFKQKNSIVYLDSARMHYSQVFRDYSNSEWADNARFAMMKLEGTSKNTLMQILEQYPESELRNEILASLGDLYFEEDSLQQASFYFHQALLSGDPQFTDKCLIHLGEINYRNHDFINADSLYSEFNRKFHKNYYTPMSVYRRGQIHSIMQDDNSGDFYFKTVITQFPNTSWADSARFALGDIYINNNKIQLAETLFYDIFLQDSLMYKAAKVNLLSNYSPLNQKYLFTLARVYMEQGKITRAKTLLLQNQAELISLDSDQYYMLLSEISENEGEIATAIHYFDGFSANTASDTLLHRLALLYEKDEQWEAAWRQYQKLVQLNNHPEKKIVYNQRMIVALIRQKRLSDAQAMIKLFENSYKKNTQFTDLFSEILLEKGRFYFGNQSFSNALKEFKTIADDYASSVFLIQAKLEIGRTYLIMNKVEDALDVLTDMAQQYSDDPVTPKIYLNLGDHYFRSQQFENALIAFKKAVNDSLDASVSQSAMRYMIRIYETMGLYEAAISMVNQYLNNYPYAEDHFMKSVQLGNLYMKLRNYTKAIKHFQKIKPFADTETEAEIQFWIGKSYAEMGQFEMAILEYLKVKYLSKPTKLPWASTALFEAAQSYLQMDEPFKAKKLFQKIVATEGAASDLGRIAKQRIDQIDDVRNNQEG